MYYSAFPVSVGCLLVYTAFYLAALCGSYLLAVLFSVQSSDWSMESQHNYSFLFLSSPFTNVSAFITMNTGFQLKVVVITEVFHIQITWGVFCHWQNKTRAGKHWKAKWRLLIESWNFSTVVHFCLFFQLFCLFLEGGTKNGGCTTLWKRKSCSMHSQNPHS